MAGTLRDEREREAPRLQPVLIHAASFDALLAPLEGLRPVPQSLVVGRREGPAQGPGLWLDDKRVSTRHLELTRKGDAVLAVDLGSSNGTLLNGGPLTAPTALEDGDVLEVGRSLLCFRRVPVGEVPADGWAWAQGRTFNATLGRLAEQLDRIARSGEPVLLLGETGAGKDVAARRVHQVSGRPGPLVAIDCGAMPESLFESTLFGHEKGAFTGATDARVGDIARANRGTLFLDEVGNLPLATQAKLLRVLEEKAVRPVGGREPSEVDVRWIAATNAALSDGERFRADLRFRLAGFVARIPPVRERREDLGLLMASLLREAGVTQASLTRAAASRLVHHPLPGNVRQLRQALRSAAFLSPTRGEVTIDVEVLRELDEAAASAEPGAAADPPPRMSAPDKEALEAALRAAQGRVAVAARALGTSSRQLYRWLERLEVDPDAFRAG